MKNILNLLLFLTLMSGLTSCSTKSDSNAPTATTIPAFLSVTYDSSAFVVSGQCSSEHIVNILDINNNPASATVDQLIRLTSTSNSVSFYSDIACKSKVTSVQIKAGSSTGKFYVIDSTVEYFSYTVATTNIKSDSESHTVVSANAARLLFTGPNSVQAGQCSLPFSLKTLDINGKVSTVSSDTAISFNGLGIGKIYTTPDCSGVAVTSVTIPAQSNSAVFYFNTTKIGSYSLLAAAPGNVTSSLFVSSKAGNPSQVVFLTSPPTLTAGECSSSVTAQYQDAFSNTATLATDSNLVLSGQNITFYADAVCVGSPITQSLVTANSSTTTFYFKATKTSTTSLSVTGSVGIQIESITVNAANGNQLVIPQIQNTVSAGGAINNSLLTIQALDKFGNIAAGANRVYSLTAYADAACSILATKPFTNNSKNVISPVSSSTGQATFSDVEYTKNEVIYLGASSSGLTSACSTAITVTPASANSLVLSGPVSVKAGQCSSPYFVNTTDTYKNISSTSSLTNIALSGQGGGNFYQLSDCSGNPINTVSIPSGQSVARFYFKSINLESLILTASGFGVTTGSNPATSPLTVTSGSAMNLVFSAPSNGVAGQCVSGISVTEQDSYGNNAAVDTDTTINLSTNGFGKFYTDSSCSNNVTFFSINAGTSSRSLYFQDTKAESTNLTASGASIITKSMNITPSLATKLKIVSPSSAIAGNLVSGLSVSTLDSYGNLQTNSANSIGLTVFSDTMCSNELPTQFVGDRTVTATSGVSNFINLKYNATSVIYVKATSGNLSSDCSNSISVGSGAPTLFSIAADLQAPTVGKCVGVTASTKDSLGNNANESADTIVSLTNTGSAKFYSDTSCGSQISAFTILSGNSTGKVYFKDAKAETLNLLMDSTGFTQGSTQIVFNSDVPSQLKMTGPFSVIANACSAPYGVILLDQYGNTTSSTTNKLIQLQAGGSANFYSDVNCSNGISSITITPSSSSVIIYMKDTNAETINLGVTGVSLVSAAIANCVVSPSFVSQVTVNTGLNSIGAGICSGPVNIGLKDSYGNIANTNIDRIISYETTSSILFYENSACAGIPVSSSTIVTGNNSKIVYVKNSTSEIASVNFTSSGLNKANQSFSVVPSSPTQIAFVSVPKTIIAGSCSGAVEVGLSDSLNNETKAASAVALSFSLSGISYYSTPDCSGSSTTVVQIPANTMSAVIYAKATLTSSNVISVSSSLGNATQSFTVNPSAPVKVLFSQLPTTGSPGTPVFSTSINTYIADNYGNKVTSSAALIEIDAYGDATCASPSSTSFTGTTIQNAASGAANYSNLGYTASGAIYVKAQSVGLSSACSNIINISASAPYKLVVSGPNTGNAGSCIGPFVVTTKDSLNNTSNSLSNIVVSFTGGAQSKNYVASDCSGSAVASQTIATGTSSISFYIKDSVSENFTLTGSSTLGYISIPMNISSLSPALIAVVGPSYISAKACAGPFKITSLDAYSNPSNVSHIENIAFGALTNMKVFSDSACSSSQASTSIVSGASTTSIYLMDSTVENVTLLLTGSSLGSASDSVTVNSSTPTAIAINTSVMGVSAGDCAGPFEINLKDSSGANAATVTNMAVGLTGGSGQFYTTSSCGTPVSAVTVAVGTATKQFWFMDTSAEVIFLTAAASGFSQGLYPLTINAGAISSLAFVSAPPSSVVSGQIISPAVKVSYSDQYGNKLYYSASPIVISLLNEDGSSANAPLSGTLSMSTDSSSSYATFSDLIIIKSGRYKIKASGGSYSKIGDVFTVQGGAATQISIVSGNSQQMGRQGTSTALIVLVQDSNNNPASATVTYNLSGLASLLSGQTNKTFSTTADITTGTASAFVYSAQTVGSVTVTATISGAPTVNFTINVVNYSPLTAVLIANEDLEIETSLSSLNIMPIINSITPGTNLLSVSLSVGPITSPTTDSSGYSSQSNILVSAPLSSFNVNDSLSFNLTATYPNGITSGTCNYSPSTDLSIASNLCSVANLSMTMNRSDIDGNLVVAKVSSAASFSSSYDTLNSNALQTKKLTLRQVGNINQSGSDEPQNFTTFGSNLYFSAQAASGVRKLFKLDASNKITQIMDINSGLDDNPRFLTTVGSSYLYFLTKNSNSADKLYRYDGSSINAVSNLIGNNTVSDSIGSVTTDGVSLYMNASSSYSSGSYIYKGFKVTSAGISQFTNISGSNAVSDNLTSMVSGTSFPFISFGYKSADGTKSNLYLYNGTNNIKVSSTSGGLNDNANVISTDSGVIYFTANNSHGSNKMYMMIPDSGTNYYTSQVTNILGDSFSDGIQFLGACNQQMFFAAKVDTSTSNYKLYNYDSKTGSVNKLSDNNIGGTDFAAGFEKGACYGGQLYLPMLDRNGNTKLFHHNGVRLSQVSNIKSTSESISGLVVFNNTLYFAAEESATGNRRIYKLCDSSQGCIP